MSNIHHKEVLMQQKMKDEASCKHTKQIGLHKKYVNQ